MLMKETFEYDEKEDIFGENYVLEDLEEWLLGKNTGCTETSIKKYVASLRTFSGSHASTTGEEA